jgi:hypothetical protein
MIKKYFVIIFMALILIGCKKKPDPILNPTKTILVLPAMDELCTTGVVISAAKSTVNFNWNTAQHTDSYQISIKNLLTDQIITQNTANISISIELDRNTPYSWSVKSLSNTSQVVEQSDIWKFYNSGPGAVSYAPFPAEIIAPVMGQNVSSSSAKVKLEWKGSDVDKDIKSYDVYFGTSAPVLIKEDVMDSFLGDINILANTQYYWKIVTRDHKGNTSDSGIYRFKTN